MAMGISPAGKFRLTSDCLIKAAILNDLSEDVTESIEKSAEKASVRQTRKGMSKLRKLVNGISEKIDDVLPKISEPEAATNLLKACEQGDIALDALIDVIQSIPNPSLKNSYSEFLPGLNEIRDLSNNISSKMETRLAQIIRQKRVKEVLSIEETEKGKITEPDEEAWEELRRLGEEGQYFTRKAFQDLE